MYSLTNSMLFGRGLDATSRNGSVVRSGWVAALFTILAAPLAVHAQAVPTTGTLRVVPNRPQTTVRIDGAAAVPAPLETPLSAGAHDVRIEAPGMRSWQGRVDVPSSTRTFARALLRPTSARGDAAIPVTLTAFAAAATIVFGSATAALRSGLDASLAAGTLDNHDSRIGIGQTLAYSTDIGLGVTSIGVALSLWLLLREVGPPSTVRFRQAAEP